MPNHNGIINNAVNTPADQFKAPVVKPVTTQVNAGNETVESRLNNITAKGSTYTNLAAKNARREANNRGLVNSTMAAAAGTEAAIKAALPIAQQDAKTYTDTRFNNQNVKNTFLENRQGANLNQEVATQASNLKKGEMVLGDTLQQSQNAQNANLNIKVATAQSGLTNQENTLLNRLTMKRDQGLSALTQAEQAQLSALQTKRDAAQSGNVINQQAAQSGNIISQQNNQSTNTIAQQNNQSGLTQAENAQLNALTMKRDQGLSTLTQAENAQLNQLQIKRDSAQSANTMAQQSQANQLAINRDNNSAALNQSLATLESGLRQSEMKLDAGLKLTLEQTLQGQKFSDNAKMNILASINQIISDSQSQIVQVGLSNRTGAQQAAAIIDIQTNRDAALAVYQNMLKSMPGWKWDTNFTPAGGTNGGVGGAPAGKPSAPAAGTNYPTYPTDPAAVQQLNAAVSRGAYKDSSVPPSGTLKHGFYGGRAEWWASSDRKWRYDSVAASWIPASPTDTRGLF